MRSDNQSNHELDDLIRDEYSRQDEEHRIMICPDDLASLVYDRIDKSRRAPTLVRISSLFDLKQRARGVCRERANTEDPDSETQSVMLFALQPRYPTSRDGRGGYVLREELTYRERRENSNRLRKEAASKLEHARALDAETDKLVRDGKLKPDEPTQGDQEGPSLPLQ